MLPSLKLKKKEGEVQTFSPKIPVDCPEHLPCWEVSGFACQRQQLADAFCKGLDCKEVLLCSVPVAMTHFCYVAQRQPQTIC